MEAEGCRSATATATAVDPGNPLLRAVFLRRLRLTRLLLEGGAYVNESDGRGQTPLMVACRTPHADAQSASRVKLVQLLLEKGADPNIQDQDGRSALAHACRERAGAKVVALLLASGAEAGLEDRSGTSALVHAVVAQDRKVLRLLLDSCKAKGKEVIIITTDKFPDGRLRAQQHQAPASPSQVIISTTSPKPDPATTPQNIFSFRNAVCGGSPGRQQHQQQQQLQRLNSEPWLKIPATVLHQQPPHKDLDQSVDSVLSVPRGAGGATTTSSKLPEGRLLADKETREPRKDSPKHVGEKSSLRSLLSSHSASHPDLHSESSASKTLQSLASSSLHSIIQRRRLGPHIYASDPQLPQEPAAEARKLAPLRCSSTLSSREAPPSSAQRKGVLSMLERRGSGPFLSPARPRSLPPLALGPAHAPTPPGAALSEEDSVHRPFFLPAAPPGPPRGAAHRMLLRRHSMQTEQLKTTA